MSNLDTAADPTFNPTPPPMDLDLQHGIPDQDSAPVELVFTQAQVDEQVAAATSGLNEQVTALKQQVEGFTEPRGDDTPPPPASEPTAFATPEAEIAHLKVRAADKLVEAHGIIQRLESVLHNRAPSSIFLTFHRAMAGMKDFLAEI